MSDLARTPELVVAWMSLSDFCRDCREKTTCERRTLAEVEACEYTIEQRRRDADLQMRGELPMLRGSALPGMIADPTAIVRRRSTRELEDEDEGPPWVEIDA